MNNMHTAGDLFILFDNDDAVLLVAGRDNNVSIGRTEDNDIVLNDMSVADTHAVISFARGGWWLEDKNTSTGTYTSGEAIERVCISDATVVDVAFGDVHCTAQVNAPTTGESSGDTNNNECEHDRQGLMRAAKTFLTAELYARIDFRHLQHDNLTDDQLNAKVRGLLVLISERNKDLDVLKSLTEEEATAVATEILHDTLGLGPLEYLLDDDTVTEIMVLGHDTIFVERDGILERTDLRFPDDDRLRTVIERIVAPLGRRIDEASPMVDGRLKDGSRISAAIPPVSPDGPALTIRKFGKHPIDLHTLIHRYNSMTVEMSDFLKACITAKKNILISGGTGSGKTSLLNALSGFIGNKERIITIEDALELQLQQEHVLRFETRPPNIENKGEIGVRDALRHSLRHRPDRIVVGECRGGEALDMLQAMNTGHDGSMTTVHANSPEDAVYRLETLVLMSGMDLPLTAIKSQISAAIDIIVQQSRLADGTRKVTRISELVEFNNGAPSLRTIFAYHIDHTECVGGVMRVTGRHIAENAPGCVDDFRVRGIEYDLSCFGNTTQSVSAMHHTTGRS